MSVHPGFMRDEHGDMSFDPLPQCGDPMPDPLVAVVFLALVCVAVRCLAHIVSGH